jgi:hypothetical protein
VTCPQAQRRDSLTCSVTSTRGWGKSNTWRRATPVTSAPARSPPQRAHQPGGCTTTASGSATWRIVAPGSPGCLPGRRFDASRKDRRRAWRDWRSVAVSDDGGSDEFDEFWPSFASRSATRRDSASIVAACRSISRRCWSTSASSSAIRSPGVT